MHAFLPFVFTTPGGIGPPETLEWLDSIFLDSFTRERLSSHTTLLTSYRRALLYRSLLATLVRSCADMAHDLSHTAQRQHNSFAHSSVALPICASLL